MRIIGSSYPHNKLSLFLYFKVLKFLQSAYSILLSTGPKTLLVSVCYLYDPPYFKIAELLTVRNCFKSAPSVVYFIWKMLDVGGNKSK